VVYGFVTGGAAYTCWLLPEVVGFIALAWKSSQVWQFSPRSD
jgi:hypothetical protein